MSGATDALRVDDGVSNIVARDGREETGVNGARLPRYQSIRIVR